jgi:hypothetical protein
MTPQPEPASPFRAGAIVIAILANPREKFWGAILQLSSVGLSMRGVDLSSFETFIGQIRDGEPFAAGAMFFPMHRIERLELDLPEGTLPSLAQRFAQKTGMDPAPMLVSEFLPAAPGNGEELRAGTVTDREEERNEAGDSGTGSGESR